MSKNNTSTKSMKTPKFAFSYSGSSAISLYRLIAIIVFLLFWEWVGRSGLVNPLFLAPPSKVVDSIGFLHEQGLLFPNILATLKAAFAGFLLGLLVGSLFGFVIGLNPILNKFCAPFITMMNSTPRIALAPLFVLWFGIGISSRIVLVFSLVVFIVLTNTIAGTENIDKDHLVLAKLNSAKRRDIIFKVALPSVVPWIIAAMRVSFAYALAGAVVGEMFLGQEGLGYLITAGSGVFNVSLIFAALGMTIAIAFIVDRLMGLLEKRILRWRA